MATFDAVDDIKPKISVDEAVRLVNKLYGLQVTEIRELDSYDDRNFFVACENSAWPHGFVLKIINSSDSLKLDFFDAQNEILLALQEKGFPAPIPVKTLGGTYHALEELPHSSGTRRHLVKLFEYQPGKVFKAVPPSLELCQQVGVWTAKLDLALKDFRHEGITNHKTQWHMTFVPQLKPYLQHVKDLDRRNLVSRVIGDFNRKIVPVMEQLPRGVIHGDVNEQNILVDSTPDGGWRVSAMLDFGDANVACYLFDVAAAVCYMMLDGPRGGLNPMQCARATLAGYTTVSALSNLKLSLLQTAVCARLCQSLVLGLYSHTLRPDNSYIMVTQENGWLVLESLCNMTQDQFNNSIQQKCT